MSATSPVAERSGPAVRRSPVAFDAMPSEIVRREGWDIVLEFEDGAPRPEPAAGARLIDLSHRCRWDFQDRRIDARRPFGLAVPEAPGGVAIVDGLMINRMNRTQASIWHIGPGAAPATPAEVAFTDTTDSHCWLAVIGAGAPSVLEHLTSLDLFPPTRAVPFLTQGPILGIPCQTVTCGRDCLLTTFSRGYGQSFVEAALHSVPGGALRPGGERVFTERVVGLDAEAG